MSLCAITYDALAVHVDLDIGVERSDERVGNLSSREQTAGDLLELSSLLNRDSS